MMDTQALLQALEGASPCGEDMSFSAAFDTLREMRREDDPTLSQGEWITEIKRADWPGVLRTCTELLTQRTKDLRVAGWWVESATRVQGYEGLANGLDLYAGLCRDHWAAVHPLPEGDDQELRIGSVGWLVGLVPQWCRSVVVLRHGDEAYALRDIDIARQRQLAPLGSEMATGHPNMEDIARVQRQTPLPQVAAALEQARRLPAAVASLQAVIDARLGADGPGFAPLREAVADAVSALERLGRDMGLPRAGDAPTEAADPALPPAETGAGVVAGGAPQTRAQALAQLRMVAEFFRRTEPHSPVAYLADRAAAWGAMPLHAWLRTVLKDQATLSQLEELLGVEKPPTAEGDAA